MVIFIKIAILTLSAISLGLIIWRGLSLRYDNDGGSWITFLFASALIVNMAVVFKSLMVALARCAPVLIVALLFTGCATTRTHDVIPSEVAGIFEAARNDALTNYRRQWQAEPVVPHVRIYLTDREVAETSGLRITLSRRHIARHILAHEIGHCLKNVNGKGTGEDHL